MARFYSIKNQFLTGSARFRDLMYFGLKDRKMLSEEVEHTRLLALYKGQWAHLGDTNWSAAAMCVVKKPQEKLVVISDEGDVLTYAAGEKSNENIETQFSVIRNMSTIEGLAYACGMKREVFRRDAENTWVAMHAPTPEKGKNAGFEAISGFKSSEIYAVGWNGEIWRWDGEAWSQFDSPSDLILTGISCAPDGHVYICGQHGTLIQGRNERWETLDVGEFTRDLWDVRWFSGKLYLATMSALWVYETGGLQPVDFGSDRPGTCYRLTDAEGILWSIGTDDVFSFDGTNWTRID